MKLVFVNRYYWPDRSATSQLLTDLATTLAADGRQVLVVAGNREQEPAAARLSRRERDRGVEVVRLRTTALARFGLLGRAIDDLLFYVAALWFVLARVGRGDTVVAKTDPPMLAAVLAPALRLKGATLITWLQDVYPEIAERLGTLGVPLIPGALRRLRDRALRSARLNVAVGERMGEFVRAAAGSVPVRVVHNWSPTLAATATPAPDNPYRRQLGLTDEVLVAYSGNLGRAHRFEAMLGAGEHLRERRGLRFAVIGDGPRRAAFETAARERGLANWSFLPPQPRERLADSLGAADIHLVSLEPRLEGLIVPSKVYGVLAAGRPCIFIGAPDGEVAGILRRFDCGITVDPEAPAALVMAVEQLAGDDTLRRRLGANARKAFEEHFTAARAYAQWRDLLVDQARST